MVKQTKRNVCVCVMDLLDSLGISKNTSNAD